jgi:hypothetical protein
MREVMVIIVGDYLHSYTNIEFNTVEELDKLIDEAIEKLEIGFVSAVIEDSSNFTQKEIKFLQEHDVEIN